MATVNGLRTETRPVEDHATIRPPRRPATYTVIPATLRIVGPLSPPATKPQRSPMRELATDVPFT